ncbi:MAG: flavin reductase family protein [Alphaproteobacteria bacterium]|nr:flavin reductase family protein [Alphaproteobacteria bacterium]
MRKLPLDKVYRLLEPGPVVLLATAQRGRANVMAMSWHMMMEFEPPLVGCIVSGRNHSFTALRATRECVIAIPTVELARQVVAAGNCSGRDLADKFAEVGLTPVPAAEVAAPLIAECWVNLECRVADTRMVARYNMFVLEVVRAWHDPARKRPRMIHHQGFGTFAVDGRSITLRSRKP